jgi:molybdopterin-containing oxidoreductase family iron-sulfur binding subunit
MDGSRRSFLKFAGLTALGVAGGTSVKAVASGSSTPEPAAAPGEKRWAMVVDLRKFHNNEELVKRCVEACHKAHNVPAHENPKDQIEWVWAEDFHTAFHEQSLNYIREDLEHTPTLLMCNHCDNPPCVRVCPTKATWKRESDGIVMMDWHRCIGCRYCMVGCPYGSRSFNWRDPRSAENLDEPHELEPTFPTRMRGVVEKCTFCDERIADGKLPACVEACTDNELIFGDLNDADSPVREILHKHLAIRRKPGLGTEPEVYYIVDSPETLHGGHEPAQPAVAADSEGTEADHV